ncbi:hypothetical protein SBD_1936 [Streptomyces bottropensis ATCC 25435]|uniref:Uncharacterized protein n=1 Tax=Streptomyces bottropensis ATCC 25435 TaxID=1054862 RepID=M3DII7_9ACTN|nr:hypothetical protein SBD_1936 [Streptomyces bottropensis ATCC 25435]
MRWRPGHGVQQGGDDGDGRGRQEERFGVTPADPMSPCSVGIAGAAVVGTDGVREGVLRPSERPATARSRWRSLPLATAPRPGAERMRHGRDA